MADYAGNAVTALRLIESKGGQIVIKAPVATGEEWAPYISYTSTPASGVRLNYSERELMQSSIEIGDCKFLIPGAEDVKSGYKIIDVDGTIWHVIDVTTLNPAGIPVLHTVQVRR